MKVTSYLVSGNEITYYRDTIYKIVHRMKYINMKILAGPETYKTTHLYKNVKG